MAMEMKQLVSSSGQLVIVSEYMGKARFSAAFPDIFMVRAPLALNPKHSDTKEIDTYQRIPEMVLYGSEQVMQWFLMIFLIFF